ncbi:MAG: T9SS type A sorting domain-containing protein [Ignavibacteriales bacterium]|nr:T9SS type A sorting domain-containing protein [Ignavibacteriales bacterium]
MNTKLVTLLISLITLGSLSAQSFIGKLNPFPPYSKNILADDTVKILAVMVNFQEDKDGATFGNGKFGSIYSQSYGNDILDPLPHDKNYFESHLTFAKNYFTNVSNGKQELSFTVLSDTFSVSKTMRNYSPAPGSDDYTPVGDFAKEVWIKAAQINPTINFSEYDVFLIFHAGVGRDISLPGSIGNERDLPSLYLSDTALRNIFGGDLTGLPVNRSGKFNSMIIPETESRELETLSGKFLFEITINGLIIASIASHLGLPDLFDTETGLSAIGRFGLMDGQSIFAYNGCFPPEPSAWEKIYLGWTNPIEIPKENLKINLTSKLAATLADTVIIKVSINSSEYYLIENRQRDVSENGANVTYITNGNVVNKNFEKDTTGFYSYDIDSLKGVVLNVDEFDWALPGNGIVIWHIDESVINDKLADNKINVDKEKRGVDVEEADGIQDIGEKYITVFGDEVIGEGTEEDFWFGNNKTKLFKNKFAKDTRPDTKSNSGANSLITIKGFSNNASKMSFNIEFGDSIIKPIFSSLVDVKGDASITTIQNANLLFAINSDSMLVVTNGDSIIHTESNFSDFKPASVAYGNNSYLIGISAGNQQGTSFINIWRNDLHTPFVTKILLSDIITTTPVISNSLTEDLKVILGTNDGNILIFDLDSLLNGAQQPESEILVEQNTAITKISDNLSNLYAIAYNENLSSNNYSLFINGTILKFSNEELLNIVTTKDKDGVNLQIVSSRKDGKYLYNVLLQDVILSTFAAPDNINSALEFSLADLKNDGGNYLLTANLNKLYAYNLNGSLADNFPFIISDDEFISVPLAADIEGDSKAEIIAFTKNGLIYAIDGGTGKVVDGFPISVGQSENIGAALFNFDNTIGLAVINQNNILTGWNVSSIDSRIDWAEVFGNNFNQSTLGSALSTNTINEFFPTSRAYNYPNPVYEGQTAIRYFVKDDSKINIKIFDLAGDFVAELNDVAQGGMDNETVWNVDEIQSGVYLARIEASSSSGKTESVVIKIAVIK